MLEFGTLIDFIGAIAGQRFQVFVLVGLHRVSVVRGFGGKHQSDGLGVNFVVFGLAQRKTFAELVGLKRIENESWKFFAEQKAEKIVGIMSSRFEPDSYISVIARENFGVKLFKTFVIVGERKCLVKNFSFDGLDNLCPESSCELNRPAVSDLSAVKQRAAVRISIKPLNGR